MANEKWRLDLRKDVREVLAEYMEDDPTAATAAIVATVMPHFELAYKRGVMGERSRQGYKALRNKKEESGGH